MKLPAQVSAPLRVRSRVPASQLEYAEVLSYDGTNAVQVVRWLNDPRLAYLSDAEDLMLLHPGTDQHFSVLQPCVVVFERWSPQCPQRYVLRTSNQRFAEIIFALDEVLPSQHRCSVFDRAPSLGFVVLDVEETHDKSDDSTMLDEVQDSIVAVCRDEVQEVAQCQEAGDEQPQPVGPIDFFEPASEQEVEQAAFVFEVDFQYIEPALEDECQVIEQEPVWDGSCKQAAFASIHQLRAFRMAMRGH